MNADDFPTENGDSSIGMLVYQRLLLEISIPRPPGEEPPVFRGLVGFPRKAKMELETGDTVDGNQKSGDLKQMDEKTSPIFGPFP